MNWMITEQDVIREFSENTRSIPTGFELVGQMHRHGRTFYKRGDSITDESGKPFTAAEVVKWVNATRAELERGREAPFVQSDCMEGLKHPLTGQVIDSKSKFREMTRAHGGIEVGNESLTKEANRVKAQKELERRASLQETIKKHIQLNRGV